MSDSQQPEEMRPIPDGGLQDAMPGWLKRPPAWRSMPTAEERRERSLPEPDTSLIDPRALLDVNDLPKWLQSIAARGDIPLPEPDEVVEYAISQVQAATEQLPDPAPDLPAQALVADHLEPQPEVPAKIDGILTDEPSSSPVVQPSMSPVSVVLIAIPTILLMILVLVYFFN